MLSSWFGSNLGRAPWVWNCVWDKQLAHSRSSRQKMHSPRKESSSLSSCWGHSAACKCLDGPFCSQRGVRFANVLGSSWRRIVTLYEHCSHRQYFYASRCNWQFSSELNLTLVLLDLHRWGHCCSVTTLTWSLYCVYRSPRRRYNAQVPAYNCVVKVAYWRPWRAGAAPTTSTPLPSWSTGTLDHQRTLAQQ